MLLVSASSSAVNLPCSMPWSVTRLFRRVCSSHSGAYCGSVWRRTSRRVRMRDGSWQDIAISALKEYVTEELNPENKRGVDGAEVFVPSPLLSSGMCFVDTPVWVRSSLEIQQPRRRSFLTLMQHWLW